MAQCFEAVPLTPVAQAALDRAAELYKPPWSTKNVKGEFDITEEKRPESKKTEESRIFMPYQVPEPVVHDPRALEEDKTIRHFVPLSDRKWYKTLRDQSYDLPDRPERSVQTRPRPRPRRAPLGGALRQTYEVPLPPRITEQYGPRWKVPSEACSLDHLLETSSSPSPPDSEDELEPGFSFSPVGSPARYRPPALDRRQEVKVVREETRKKHTVSQLTSRRRRSLSPTYIELMRPVSEVIRAPERRSPTPERTPTRSPSPTRVDGSVLQSDSTSPYNSRSSTLQTERTFQELTQTPFSLDHAPRVTVRMRSHRVPAGQNTKFTLNVRARPDGEVTWCHNGVQITESSKYVFTNMTGVLTIAILDCQAEDSGTYRCTVTNAKGEASDYGTLDVTKGEFTTYSSRRKDQESAKAYIPEMSRVDHYRHYKATKSFM